MSNYSFGRTAFKNYLWIKGGKLFKDPIGLDIEMSNKGAFTLEVYDWNSSLVRTYRKKNSRGNWTSFYLNQFGIVDEYGTYIPALPPGSYKFKLVNASSGTRRVRQGSLDYA